MDISTSSCNPFTTQERLNFPEWSPLFSNSSKTPPNTNGTQRRRKDFHWSIDQLSKLKPVDIATSPASLAVTNLASPLDDPRAQHASDKFFSQKAIFPSPWLLNKPKRVTFSPHPPTTSYYTKEDHGKIDAATQTVLSIPVNVDLEKLLGNEFLLQNGSEDETSFSLRRKLFGQPQRPSLSSSSCSCCHDNDDDSETANPETRDTHVEGVAVTPTELRLSSTPLRSSPSPAAVIITKLTSVEDIASSTNQCSSFIDSSLLNKCSLSPIKLEPEVTPPTSSFNEVGSGQLQLVLSPIVSEAVDTSIESHFNSLSSTPHSIVKSISSTIPKRPLPISPHGSPLLKQPCIHHHQSPTHDSTHLETVPPTLLTKDLQLNTSANTSSSCPPSTCTTYFNNLVLDDADERPLQSMTSSSSWQPNVHSTMLECAGVGHAKSAAPPSLVADSGFSREISQLGVSSSVRYEHSQDSGISQRHATPPVTPTTRTSPVKYSYNSHSLLPSRLKLTYTPTQGVVTTPTSRYTMDDSPFSQDLLRKKSYFKAKLNFKSPTKQVPLRTPLTDKHINSLTS